MDKEVLESCKADEGVIVWLRSRGWLAGLSKYWGRLDYDWLSLHRPVWVWAGRGAGGGVDR